MGDKDKISANKEIRNLIFLIGSAVGFAVLAAVGLVWYYGPSGLYEAKHTLLSPDFFQELKYSDSNPETGGSSVFVFDTISFIYYDNDLKRWDKVEVSKEKYRQFYQLISGDVSEENVSPQLIDRFTVAYPATLELRVKVKNGSGADGTIKTFQEVVFINEGDDYRVELHESTIEKKWAYFHHPSIYQKAMNIFTK